MNGEGPSQWAGTAATSVRSVQAFRRSKRHAQAVRRFALLQQSSGPMHPLQQARAEQVLRRHPGNLDVPACIRATETEWRADSPDFHAGGNAIRVEKAWLRIHLQGVPALIRHDGSTDVGVGGGPPALARRLPPASRRSVAGKRPASGAPGGVADGRLRLLVRAPAGPPGRFEDPGTQRLPTSFSIAASLKPPTFLLHFHGSELPPHLRPGIRSPTRPASPIQAVLAHARR